LLLDFREQKLKGELTMLKVIMGMLMIAASFLSGSTKQLTIAAAQASETHESGSGDGHGATCD